MMGFGIGDVIALLLGLQSFGVATNPHPPTPEISLQYAVPDADLVAHVDLASILPGNYKALLALPTLPAIARSPEAAKLAQHLVDEVRGPHDMLAAMGGIDPVTDISDLTAFVHYVPHDEPLFLVELHGKLTAAQVDKLALITGHAPTKVGGGEWVDLGQNHAFGITATGTMLAGTLPLVRERVADSWKAPSRGAGSTLGYAATVLAGKPVFAVVVSLSKAAREHLLELHDHSVDFATDLVKRHKLASFSVFHDGIGWQWIDSTPVGYDSMATISEGAVDVLRSLQIGPHGLAKIALGGMESYRGRPEVDAVLAHRAELEKLIDTYTGGGGFKAAIDKDPKGLKIAVRLTGASLGQVVPLAALAPVAGLGMFVMRTKRSADVEPQPMFLAPPVRLLPLPPTSRH